MAKSQAIRVVAIYCRVSTGDQSTALQAADLQRYAEHRGWQVTTVVEEKASGAKTRPRREELIAAAKAGHFDALLVWSLSRWGRSMIDVINTVRALDEAGVAFVSLKEGFDLSTSQGRLLMNLLASLSEFEREQIVERVTAGVRHAQKHGTRSGKAIGRPATVRAKAVEIRALASQGSSMTAIGRKLGIGYGSVWRVLRNPVGPKLHR